LNRIYAHATYNFLIEPVAMLNRTFGVVCAVCVSIFAYFVLHNLYGATTADITQNSLLLALLVGVGLLGHMARERLRKRK
jgi:hypothetical protein